MTRAKRWAKAAAAVLAVATVAVASEGGPSNGG